VVLGAVSRRVAGVEPGRVLIGLDAFLDIGVRLPAFVDQAPVDEGGVPGQVARATGA